VYKIFVAVDTSVLSDPLVARFDLNRVVVILERKGDRMKEAVVGLGYPFTYEIMGQMAVVAARDMMMTTFLPRVKMLLHHVTVCTGLRIVAEITGPLTVTESKDARPCEQP